MKCPVDGSYMIVVEHQKIELDYCTVCKGIWFDAGELTLLAEALGRDIKLPEMKDLPEIVVNEKKRPSPRTGKPMKKVNMGSNDQPIIIDIDKDGHGLWFDWGELSKVLETHSSAVAGGKIEIIKFLGETFRF